jgi:DNA-binding transcriptional regulator YiaG
MTLMALQVQKVAVSKWSYTQKADENVAMVNKASPSLAAQFLKNYREKNHLTQVQLAEDLKVEPRTLRAWKNSVRSRRRSQRDESCP